MFIKLHLNVPLSETMCITHDSASQTQGQGHTSKSRDFPFNVVSAPYVLNPNVPLSDTLCQIHDSATQIQGQGHWIYLSLSCLLHISCKKQVSIIRKYHNHTLLSNIRHREKDSQNTNSHKTSGRRVKV